MSDDLSARAGSGGGPAALRAPAYRPDLAGHLRRIAAAGLSAADACCAALTPHWVREQPLLVIMALHSLCAHRPDLDDPALAPNQTVCLADFRSLVAAILDSGCTIVSLAQLHAGLPPGRSYAMLTFDDGYFNGVLALEVLREFNVPAAFFISSNHVLQGKCFWWDALARELHQAGAPRPVRAARTRELKQFTAAQIEAILRVRFGDDVLRPRGDSDRPFTAAELTDFARHPLVQIGNHTADHEILTRCGPDEARRQIEGCQDALRALTGRTPIAIAYPNGNHSPAVIEAARAAGLCIGLTVDPGRNALPAPGAPQLMRLARFYFHGRSDPAREFRACRGGFLPGRLVRALLAPG